MKDQSQVLTGSAGEVFGRARVQTGVAALRGRYGQGSVRKDVHVSALRHWPPLPVPRHLGLRLPVGPAVQTHGLA